MALFYEEWHTGSRETILWLHAAGVSGWMWHPEVDRLPEYHHLVPDLPEHGRSLRERPFSMPKLADQLARLIEQHAHYSRAHVVGHGLGALVACELLARHPGRLGRAVLSAPPLRREPETPLERLYSELSMRAYMPVRNLPFLVRATMRSRGIPERYRTEVAADTRRLTLGAMRRALRLEHAGVWRPAGLEQPGVPTLVVVAEGDRPLVRQSGERLVGLRPKAAGAIARGRGPAWSLEDPEAYAAMVRAWLTEAPLPPGLAPLAP